VAISQTISVINAANGVAATFDPLPSQGDGMVRRVHSGSGAATVPTIMVVSQKTIKKTVARPYDVESFTIRITGGASSTLQPFATDEVIFTLNLPKLSDRSVNVNVQATNLLGWIGQYLRGSAYAAGDLAKYNVDNVDDLQLGFK
jgi:autonomous glycyl radical cofactor GrcA